MTPSNSRHMEVKRSRCGDRVKMTMANPGRAREAAQMTCLCAANPPNAPTGEAAQIGGSASVLPDLRISLSVTMRPGFGRRAAARFCTPATETAQDCFTITGPGPSWMIQAGVRSPDPGSSGVFMHSADVPASREPILEPRRHPGVPAGVFHSLTLCAATRDQLRRQGRRAQCSRHNRPGCQHHGNPEDPVGGRTGRSRPARRCITIRSCACLLCHGEGRER